MTHITCLCMFPEIIERFSQVSLMSKGAREQKIKIDTIDIKKTQNEQNIHVDDAPYGGGSGQIIRADYLKHAFDKIGGVRPYVLFPRPAAPVLSQDDLSRFSRYAHIAIVCGRYEGIDERFCLNYVDEVISLGEYVFSSGETAAMVLIEGIYRLIPGSINSESLKNESYAKSHLLEYPQYTRPPVFEGMEVPQVLSSGHHARIREWQKKQSISTTIRYQPHIMQ